MNKYWFYRYTYETWTVRNERLLIVRSEAKPSCYVSDIHPVTVFIANAIKFNNYDNNPEELPTASFARMATLDFYAEISREQYVEFVEIV